MRAMFSIALIIISIFASSPVFAQDNIKTELANIKAASSARDYDMAEFTRTKNSCASNAGTACAGKLAVIAKQIENYGHAIRVEQLKEKLNEARFGVTQIGLDLQSLAVQEWVLCAEEACKDTIVAAGMYAAHGDKADAKKLYRHVVVTFTGDDYKGCVRQAEFGLEDLKEAK